MLKALFRALQKRSNYFLLFRLLSSFKHTHTYTRSFSLFTLPFSVSYISFSFSYKKKRFDRAERWIGVSSAKKHSDLEIEIRTYSLESGNRNNNDQKYLSYKKIQISIFVYPRCIFLL